MPAPLVWDFDDSVLEIAGDEVRVPLQDWQERIRFGCRKRELIRLLPRLRFPEKGGCVFLGSGDFHHLSLPLLERAAETNGEIEAVVCDNHPDNMRYPFGIHCGSWVCHASRLQRVRRIHVAGITSDDITGKQCWENYLSPLIRAKVVYWSVGKDTSWLNWVGAKNAHRDFPTPDELVKALADHIEPSRKIYLSLDKDVLGKNVVETNWDQGCFQAEHIEQLLAAFHGRLAGMDVTGEISGYTFHSRFKRLLAGRDGLEEPDPATLRSLQERHRDLNKRIIEML